MGRIRGYAGLSGLQPHISYLRLRVALQYRHDDDHRTHSLIALVEIRVSGEDVVTKERTLSGI
jgi:hypothetical protein